MATLHIFHIHTMCIHTKMSKGKKNGLNYQIIHIGILDLLSLMVFSLVWVVVIIYFIPQLTPFSVSQEKVRESSGLRSSLPCPHHVAVHSVSTEQALIVAGGDEGIVEVMNINTKQWITHSLLFCTHCGPCQQLQLEIDSTSQDLGTQSSPAPFLTSCHQPLLDLL